MSSRPPEAAPTGGTAGRAGDGALRRARARLPVASLRTRLTSLFVAIFGTTLIVFCLVVYQVFTRNAANELDAALYNYAVDVAAALNVDYFGQLRLSPNVLAESEKKFPFALGETLLQIRSLNGRPVAKSSSLGTADLPFSKPERDQLLVSRALFRDLSSREFTRPGSGPTRRYRLLAYLIERPADADFVLQIAVSSRLLERERGGLVSFFLVSVPITLLVAALGGLYLSRRALAPVNAIIAAANGITARQLSERLPEPPANDEIRELAQTLNGLLDRLERSFRSQESFIADASHQLKTPLAILRGEIDLMRAKPRPPEEVSEFLASASQEVSYLSRMVNDLLVLARMEGGPAGLAIQEVRLDEIALEVVARLDRLAAPKGARISLNLNDGTAGDGEGVGPDPLATPFAVQADPDLLRCLVENLVENAVKYSPSGGLIEVSLRDELRRVTLAVRDEGPGIPAEALPKIFDRFYRSESNREQVSGSGLGLAIVRRIVDVHGGRVDVTSEPGKGATFVAEFRKRPVDAV